jgi:chromosomal replication initiator protein
MAQSFSKNSKKAILCATVIAATEEAFGLSKGSLAKKTKRMAIAKPRHIAAYLCRKHTNQSFPQIARAFNYADHTTMIYIMKVAPKLYDDPEYAAKISEIEDAILNG